jgi:hypothetical protein
MKRLLTLAAFTLLAWNGYAQKGFLIGANAMPLNSNIINQNTWGNGREYDYKPTYNFSFGIDVGYNFSDNVGIRSGYWFTDLGQQYLDSYSSSEWERTLTLKYNMIPVMLMFNGTGSKINFLGGVGVVIANLQEAQQEWLRDGQQYSEIIQNPITGDDFDLGATDVTERFNSSDLFISLDLGARVLLGEKLVLDATLDFGYGLTDINHEDWQIPNGSGVYDPSHNAYAGLKIGLAYLLFGGE